MSVKGKGKKEAQSPVAGEAQARALLWAVARKKAADVLPVNAGASYFYEVSRGWETRILKQDEKVHTVRNSLELEQAFADVDVRTIFVPADAAVTRTVALRVCRRHGQGKTVFYEVNQDE